jgi:hypothetical protein
MIVVQGFIGWDLRNVPVDKAIMSSATSDHGERWLRWSRSWDIPGERGEA